MLQLVKRSTTLLFMTMLTVVLAACQSAQLAEPTLAGPVVPTRQPTLTPTVQPTSTPTPTLEPTSTPVPRVTNLPHGVTGIFPVERAGMITIGDSVDGTLDEETYAILYTFEGIAGQTIDILLNATAGNLDTYLLLLAPNGRELARNDDRSEGQRSAALFSVSLPENGTYSIIATRYRQRYGTDIGPFTLILDETNITETNIEVPRIISYGVTQNGILDDTNVQDIYVFEGQAGDVVDLTMFKVGSTDDLDTTVILTDSAGNEIAVNEDISWLSNYDSAIRGFILPQSGFYSVIATRYSTTSGRYELKVEKTGSVSSDELLQNQIAYLDREQSRTLLDEGLGLLASGWLAGDQYRQNEAIEVLSQVVLTYYLPPREDSMTVRSATLALAACEMAGLGFNGIADYSVYADDFGAVNARMLTEPTERATLLGNYTECENVDITALVQNAYTQGRETVQFRVMPQEKAENGQADGIVFNNPRLTITFDS